MGSTGNGKFGDYGDIIGGKKKEVDCPNVIENIRLEDVATSDYYVKNQSFPPPGTPVNLHNVIHKGRLVVKISSTGEILGNLPTKYNYLINCIQKGLSYTGNIIASGLTPVPFVVVTLNA